MLDVRRVQAFAAENDLVGRGGRGALLSGGLEAVAHAGLGALRRGHRGGHLLLLLCQQDDHHGRGRHGDDGRRGAGGAHAAHVAPRALEGCLGALFGRSKLGLPDRGSGIQVQHDGRRGGDRHPSAPPGRIDAPGARSRCGAVLRGPRGHARARPPAAGRKPHPLVAPLSDSLAARAAVHRPERLHRRAENRRSGLLGALAAPPSPHLLRGDVPLAPGRLSGRDRSVGAAGEPADLPGHAGGRDRARGRDRQVDLSGP